MAFISGTAGSVVYVSGGTTAVVGAYEWSLDVGQETPEVTAFGDQWRVYLPGIREWSGSFGMRGDTSAASQAFVRAMLFGGSAGVEFRFFAGTNYYSGSALATGGAPEIAYDGALENSFDIQGSGPLTFT